MTKKTIRKLSFLFLTLTFVLTLNACYSPSPLYGTWTDNTGSNIRFQSDGTFSAKIKTTSSVEAYQGTFTVLDNVLNFQIENPSYNVVSEWDLRGSILFIDWVTSTKEQVKLRLYHTSK